MIFTHPATEESEIEILYLKIGSAYNTDEENDYNRLSAMETMLACLAQVHNDA